MKTPNFAICLLFILTSVFLSSCGKEGKRSQPEKKPVSPSKPVFAQPSNTVVRALSPSSFDKATPGKPKMPHSSNQDILKIIDSTLDSKDKRLAALSKLGRSLEDKDVFALIGFLDRYNDADVLPPEKLNVLKNDVANVLRSQRKFPESLPWRLVSMYRDKKHDDVWRDYCIQHAGASLSRIGNNAACEEIIRLFSEVSANPAVPGSGTALIAMRNMLKSGKGDKTAVAEASMKSAASEDAPQGVRVTALQIAAELGHPEAVSVARSLVNDRSKTMHLRVSAIAALGICGDKSDLPVLEKLSSSSNYRLRLAAKAAVGKLKPSDK